jgi:hypothetical protein
MHPPIMLLEPTNVEDLATDVTFAHNASGDLTLARNFGLHPHADVANEPRRPHALCGKVALGIEAQSAIHFVPSHRPRAIVERVKVVEVVLNNHLPKILAVRSRRAVASKMPDTATIMMRVESSMLFSFVAVSMAVLFDPSL